MTGSEAARLGHPLLVLFRLRPDFVVVGAGDSFQPGRHAPLKFPFRAAQLAPREGALEPPRAVPGDLGSPHVKSIKVFQPAEAVQACIRYNEQRKIASAANHNC